jgi:CBS domain-containing protein
MAAGLPTEGTNAGKPKAGSVARPDSPTCDLSESVGIVRRRVRAAGWDTCVVVNSERVVLGILRAKELAGDPERRVEQAMRPGPSTYRPHVPISDMAQVLVDRDLPNAPITTSDGKLVGLLRREDALHAWHESHIHSHEDSTAMAG